MKLESLGAVHIHTIRFNEIKIVNKITKGVLCLNVDRHKVEA